jgi:hypothetical protein
MEDQGAEGLVVAGLVEAVVLEGVVPGEGNPDTVLPEF